jgi:SAM-dependent methyltransferase
MNEKHKPEAYDAWESLADWYASRVETKAHNAYYERPATLALLPDVRGLRVLDAGCGPGVYAERLIAGGASVVCLDASPKMVEFARRRLGEDVEIHLAYLDSPLDFLPDSQFDLVLSSLTLNYVGDWPGVFGEFARVLKKGGLLVFSIHHPFADYTDYVEGSYFEKALISITWRRSSSEPVDVPTWFRPLGDLTSTLHGAGFVIEQMLEPRPVPQFKELDPEQYEILNKSPGFLCVRARLTE